MPGRDSSDFEYPSRILEAALAKVSGFDALVSCS